MMNTYNFVQSKMNTLQSLKHEVNGKCGIMIVLYS